MSSRANVPIALRKPERKGPVPPKPVGKHNPRRLGSPANTGSLSPASQAGGALSGMKHARTPGVSFFSFASPNF